MLRFVLCLFLAPLALLGGCASLMNGGTWPVSVTSSPLPARVTVTNLWTAQTLVAGTTPFVVSLDRGAGYFRPARYQITVEKDGFVPQSVMIEGKIDGWYFGNLLVGGLLGMLVIDPLTGAMYHLPSHVHAQLEKMPPPSGERVGVLMPRDLNELSPADRDALVLLTTGH